MLHSGDGKELGHCSGFSVFWVIVSMGVRPFCFKIQCVGMELFFLWSGKRVPAQLHYGHQLALGIPWPDKNSQPVLVG